MARGMLLLLVVWLCAANGPVDQEIDYNSLADLARHAPRDVRQFIDRRMECQHWTGEEPYDKARRREIDRAIARLRCDRIDHDEKRLLKRHARSLQTLRLIKLSQNMRL